MQLCWREKGFMIKVWRRSSFTKSWVYSPDRSAKNLCQIEWNWVVYIFVLIWIEFLLSSHSKTQYIFRHRFALRKSWKIAQKLAWQVTQDSSKTFCCLFPDPFLCLKSRFFIVIWVPIFLLWVCSDRSAICGLKTTTSN